MNIFKKIFAIEEKCVYCGNLCDAPQSLRARGASAGGREHGRERRGKSNIGDSRESGVEKFKEHVTNWNLNCLNGK